MTAPTRRANGDFLRSHSDLGNYCACNDEPGTRSTRISKGGLSRSRARDESPMRRRLIRITLTLLLLPPLLAGVAGWLVAPWYLHPVRRGLTPDLLRGADASFAVTHAHREDFDVRAPDGVHLRGWTVTPPNPNGSWVLLFHGVADNRIGVIGQSEFLLRAGYSVVMMAKRFSRLSVGRCSIVEKSSPAFPWGRSLP